MAKTVKDKAREAAARTKRALADAEPVVDGWLTRLVASKGTVLYVGGCVALVVGVVLWAWFR